MNWLKTLIDNLLSWRRRRESDEIGLSAVEMKKRMPGVPVFTFSFDSDQNCIGFSSISRERHMELFFFSQSEAEAFADAYNETRGGTSLGIHTIRVPLTELLDVHSDPERIREPIRLVPELSQVQNATQILRNKDVAAHVHFSGVPVFQVNGCIFQQGGKTCQPLFLRKEDLDSTLARYEGPGLDANRIDIQVVSLEEVIHAMKDCSTSKWNDAVIVAPGFTLWVWSRWYQPFV